MTMKWKYLALTFGIGWLLGAASGLLLSRVSHFGGAHGSHFEHMRQHFSRELNLTPEQMTRLDAILQASRKKLDEQFAETRTQVEQTRSSTRAQIRLLLTPDQQGTFDKLQAKWESRRKKRMMRMTDRL